MSNNTQFEIEFCFSSPISCQKFLNGLIESKQLKSHNHIIAPPDESFSSESEIVTLVIHLINHGGLEAISSIALAIRAGLDYLKAREIVRLLIEDDKKIELTTDDDVEKIEEKLYKELLKDEEDEGGE